MQRVLVIVAVMVFLAANSGLAQEHPEHPKKGEKEHPEHPAEKGGMEMSLDELEAGITAFIQEDAKLKGGKFLVYDTTDRKPLVLALVKVHKDKLASLGGGVYFACTDMKAEDGTIYDLDFFMRKDAEGVDATEVAVHKKAGQPRYGWKEDKGIWTKVK